MWLITILCFTVSVAWILACRARERRVSLPPSPPGHWLLGNRHLLEESYSSMIFGTKLKRRYGDIISIVTPFETVIVLNSIDAATELLDKQAAITANRPNKVMLDSIMEWGRGVAWHKYNDRYKKLRKVMTSALSPTAARDCTQQHTETTNKLLKRLSDHSTSYVDAVHQMLGEFFLSVSYGYDVVENDPLVRVADEAIKYLMKGYYTRFWVDNIPILRLIPAWFPGAEFQTFGKTGKELRDRYIHEPFDDLLGKLRNGEELRPSYSLKLLEERGGLDADPESIDLIRWSAGAIFAGGSSSMLTSIVVQILMMALYPEITKKAQAEIDAVTGRNRLPRLEDADDMPYCSAYVQEVLRTFPNGRFATPHAAAEDMEYNGYLIPKGAAFYANVWGMIHDSDYYKSPFTFNPSRFLGPNPEPDPRKYVFGFGRRQCPGIHLANHELWSISTSILALFDAKPREELLARVADIGGRDSERMYEIFDYYLVRGRSEPYELVIRDPVATALLDRC